MQLPLFDESSARVRRNAPPKETKPAISKPTLAQPQQIVRCAIDVLGAIDLDVYSSTFDLNAQKRLPATAASLHQPWAGRIWMHGMPVRSVDKWVDRLCSEFENEHSAVLSAVALLPAKINAPWWRRLAAYPFCAIQGSIETIKPDGRRSSMATPHVAVYWGSQLARFASVFAPLGPIYIPYS